MNIPFLIAGSLALLGGAAHLFAGTQETLLIRPENTGKKYQHSWHQTYGAWHLITVDAFLMGIVLFWLAFTELGNELPTFIMVWMFGWSIVWVITLMTSSGARAYARSLPQWILFLGIGLFTLWGMYC